jgi:hypothetical protein
VTLDKSARNAIGRAVARLRTLFEEEFRQQASGRFGFHMEARESSGGDGLPAALEHHVEPVTALSLSPHELYQRSELVGVLEYLVREGATGGEAVERLGREAAFTAVNRLLAVRVAEAIGVLPEALSRGRQSASYRDVVRDLFPVLSGEEDQGFWMFVQVCGDELGASVPLLFDRRLPISAFIPRRPCVDSALEIISDSEVFEAWREPEALGWAYQFFNSEDERAAMRAASAAPRNARELAVRNQFFTPHYVVDWLVQNTLGHRLRQAGFDLDLPLLHQDPEADQAPLDLDGIAIIDPAAGSGHFLLGCYDLLEAAWLEQGVPPPEAAPKILRSLRGIEIDPRAAQVAQVVLLLRAKRVAGSDELEPPTIVTARAIPSGHKLELGDLFSPDGVASALTAGISKSLEDAPQLGSLLKVEKLLASYVSEPQLSLSAEPPLSVDELEEEVLRRLSQLAAINDSTPADRLFAAHASDAIRFLELCQDSYDVVLMNPPFGEPVPATKEYLEREFGPAGREVAAAFVERWRSQLRPAGRLGALTTRQVLFTDRLEEWRRRCLIVSGQLRVLVDLGKGVLDAQVEVCAFVLGRARADDGPAAFYSLLAYKDKAAGVLELSRAAIPARFVDLSLFQTLPKSIMPYWLGESVLRRIGRTSWKSIGVVAKTGGQTDDDFALLRLLWEVPEKNPDRWVPISKGGEYDPLWSEIHLAIDWERWDGANNLKEFTEGGLTYPYRTVSDHCLRWLPRGVGYLRGGPAVKGSWPDLVVALGTCFTRPHKMLVDAIIGGGDSAARGGAARNYSAPRLNSLPGHKGSHELRSLVEEALLSRLELSTLDERSRFFVSPIPAGARGEVDLDGVLRASKDLWVRYCTSQLAASVRAESEYQAEIGLSSSDIDEAWPTHPEHLPAIAEGSATNTVAIAWARSVDELIEQVSHDQGYHRATTNKAYFADRKLELVAHLVGLRASDVARAVGGLPPTSEERAVSAHDVASWWIGMAFGRFVIRPTEVQPVISARLPSSCPAMIESGDGPLLLHEDSRDKDDIVRRALEAASAVHSDTDIVKEVLQEVGDFGLYVRSSFFPLHLKNYSASRRKAPIYWRLAVPSDQWAVWIYFPRLSRETLFALVRAAEDKIKSTRVQLDTQRARKVDGDRAREVRTRIEAAESLLGELAEFAASAAEIAQSGWTPNLNDGALLCATPFAPLFTHASWCREVEAVRKNAEQGEYPWSSVQKEFFGVA